MSDELTDMQLLEERFGYGEIAPIVPDDVTGMMSLCPYQVEAVDSAYEAWRDYDAVMMVLATGLGKTVIASDVICRWPETAGRVLVIAHIQELIFQAKEKIEHHAQIHVAVEMGESRGETGRTGLIGGPDKVVVASIQTMQRRMELFDPRDWGLIIIDEFHHAGAKSYRKLWEYFKTGNDRIKLLGITATPFRGDKITLACIAEHCCFEMGIREGIDEGYLVPIQQQYIVVDQLDFSKCRTVAKDLNEGDLEEAMMGPRVSDEMTEAERLDALEKQERMLHAIAVPTIREAQGRTTLMFCVTVAHAERMAEILRRYPGVTADVVTGATPQEQRESTIAAFKAGKIQILVGVGCFTEGFDAPNVAVVAMARPTKQQGLYVQMVGRGTRPLCPDVYKLETPELRQEAIGNSIKSAMVVLDFVGNSGKHKLVSTADVLAGDMPPALVAEVIEEMKESGEAEDIREAVWKKKQKKDEEEKRQAEERERRRKEAQLAAEAKRERLRAEAEYRAKTIDPFGTETAPERVQSKFRGGATDRQVALLKKLGIGEEAAMKFTKGQAGAVIDARIKASGGSFYMRFGTHVGKQLKDIPNEYLRWAGETITNPEFQDNLAKYRDEYRQRLHSQAEDY